ncbi:hypothetical protein H0H81_007929 [Sphagnurus paluster]|uniref:Uncharacterized protein n=1 Tax=Sphagnurus paluster TaxID=117069 RepID=A0A9P7FXJ3_9AGAR|nr:hypothetical protein H0H81_007929 [Sphagnurus paluster]
MDDFSLRSNLDEEATPFIPESLEDVRLNIQRLREQIMASLPPNQLNPIQMQSVLKNLPRLTEQDLVSLGYKDSLCPICLTPYLAILAEEEAAIAMDSPAHPIEELESSDHHNMNQQHDGGPLNAIERQIAEHMDLWSRIPHATNDESVPIPMSVLANTTTHAGATDDRNEISGMYS